MPPKVRASKERLHRATRLYEMPGLRTGEQVRGKPDPRLQKFPTTDMSPGLGPPTTSSPGIVKAAIAAWRRPMAEEKEEKKESTLDSIFRAMGIDTSAERKEREARLKKIMPPSITALKKSAEDVLKPPKLNPRETASGADLGAIQVRKEAEATEEGNVKRGRKNP